METKERFLTVTPKGKSHIIAEWTGEHPNIKVNILFSGTWDECYEYAENNSLKIRGFNND